MIWWLAAWSFVCRIFRPHRLLDDGAAQRRREFQRSARRLAVFTLTGGLLTACSVADAQPDQIAGLAVALLAVSEALPFLRVPRANGVLQLVVQVIVLLGRSLAKPPAGSGPAAAAAVLMMLMAGACATPQRVARARAAVAREQAAACAEALASGRHEEALVCSLSPPCTGGDKAACAQLCQLCSDGSGLACAGLGRERTKCGGAQ